MKIGWMLDVASYLSSVAVPPGPPKNLCFAETNVSLIPDAYNSKIYSKND